jgi:hypothetical protein
MCLIGELLVIRIKQLHDTADSKEGTYFKAQDTTICEGILLLVIPRYCLHAALEHKGANPYLAESVMPVACLDSCSFCPGSYKTMFPSLIKSGVRSVLLQLFVGQEQMPTRPKLDKDQLCWFESRDIWNQQQQEARTNSR